MSKAKICASLAVLFLCLQPFSYSQKSVGEANSVHLQLLADPMVDAHGNLLFFRTVASKTDAVETEVTLISPAAQLATETYPGILSPVGSGEKAVYAIRRVPAAIVTTAHTPATLSLVALVTDSGSLSESLADYSLGGKLGLLKIASGFAADGSDVIYLEQRSSAARSVVVLTFNGTSFAPVSGSPVSLP
jgi:uncharacterized membrane protein